MPRILLFTGVICCLNPSNGPDQTLGSGYMFLKYRFVVMIHIGLTKNGLFPVQSFAYKV